MNLKWDVFISHASEDRGFVRPLAESLKAQRLAVWYDEFELKPGMKLRESIDHGLLQARYGLVILSPAFFAKSWPRWELDGLVQLHNSTCGPAVIPVWHNVRHDDVARFSPPLANIVAIRSGGDPVVVARDILSALRSQPTTVELARGILAEHGFPAPLLSDDWWLDAARWSASPFGEGTFQEASSWGWWGFPLPPNGDSAQSRAERIAWAAMQHSWQEAAIQESVTQCTEPALLLQFIERQPGLSTMVESRIDYLLSYAPQLGIAGLGGFLEPAIEAVYREALVEIAKRPLSGAAGWVLRDRRLFGVSGEDLVGNYFWMNDPRGTSPDISVIAWVDAAAWVLSTRSRWLPRRIRQRFREGLAHWSLRGMMSRGDASAFGIQQGDRWTEVMILLRHKKRADFKREARRIFEERVEITRGLLSLPESAVDLVDGMVSWGVFDDYWSERVVERRSRRTQKHGT